MHAEFSEAALLRMSELVAARLGLRFSPDRWPELARGIAETCAELGVADVEAWVDRVLGGLPTTAQLQALARHLTTGESYFFRQPEVFQHLEQHVLPALVRSRREAGRLALRVWIAGCSTGEEAYSIGILLHQALPDFAAWDLTLHANDLNSTALAKAAAGIYSDWSFRTTPPALRARYFRAVDKNRWSIAPEIRQLVRFSYLNLADAAYPTLFAVPGMFDLIFCRNVLMYFSAERQQPVLLRLRDALAADGRLILGPCDGTLAVHDLFTREPECPVVFRRQPVGQETAPIADIIPWEPPPATVAAPAPPIAVATAEPEAVAPLPRESAPADAARAAADAGDYERALQLCDQAIAHDKLNPAHHFLRGCVLIELGRLSEAGAALRNTLFLEPDFVVAHFALGTLAQQQGHDDVARRHFHRAEQLLARFHDGELVPWSDGLTAARLQSALPPGRLAR